MKKALVLGGSGFVGINLINALVDNNFKVTGTFYKKKISVYKSRLGGS